MDKNKKAILKAGLTALVVAILIAVVLLVWRERTSPKESAAQIAKLAKMETQGFPVIKTKSLDGAEVDTSNLQGKLLIVNFWASWCEPCVAEIPSLISLTKAFDGKVAVVAISGDESREDVDAFLKSFPEFKNKNISLVWDETHSLMNQFNIQRLPESFIVDKQGKLLKPIVGAINWHTPDSEAYIRQILQK